MEGRRVSRRKPRRNPLYVLFMGLLALSLVLLITVVVLGFKLKSARSDLAAAQTKIEQLRGGQQTGEDGQTVTGEDGSITGENDVSEPAQGDNMGGDNQTGGSTGPTSRAMTRFPSSRVLCTTSITSTTPPAA